MLVFPEHGMRCNVSLKEKKFFTQRKLILFEYILFIFKAERVRVCYCAHHGDIHTSVIAQVLIWVVGELESITLSQKLATPRTNWQTVAWSTPGYVAMNSYRHRWTRRLSLLGHI